MRDDYENHYHQVEEDHWWFRGRRHLVHQLITRANSDHQSKVLEIGCSGGPLMEQLELEGYRFVTGIDISAEGVALCHRRGLRDAHVMDAQKPEFPDQSFDVVSASDVLEHLANDSGALREWLRLLKPGGTLIVFVPAFQCLWTAHDEVNRHFRRYRSGQLCQQLQDCGFEVVRSSYWNCMLFMPVALLRGSRRLLGVREQSASGDMFLPASWLNRLLAAWLRFENRLLLKGWRFPFGVSAMVVARRPN